MCLSPVSTNGYRSVYFSEIGSKTSCIVPCGQCEQCMMNIRNDLFLRSRAEYFDCVKSGGAVLFLTFTYSEDNVVYKNFYLDDDGIVCLSPCSRERYVEVPNTLMCFEKRHMQNYLKSLRKYIFDSYNQVSTLRYLCVPEYGSKSTQRPHYHVLFFLHGDFMKFFGKPDNSDLSLCSHLLAVFSKFWKYGTVSVSTKGLFVDSESCISYVTKYVNKNSSLLNYSRFRDFFDFICYNFDKGYLCPIFGHDFKSPMSFFLYYCKFFECAFYVVKSIGFGSSMLDDICTDDLDHMLDVLHDGVPVQSNGELKYYRYPRYIVNKLFYNHRYDGSYYMNDLGLSVVHKLRYRSICDSIEMVSKFDWSLLDSIPLNILQPLTSYHLSSVRFDVDYFKSNCKYFFVYGMFFRNMIFSSDVYDDALSIFTEFLSDRISLRDCVFELTYLLVDYNPYRLFDRSHDLTFGDCLSDYLFDDSRHLTDYVFKDFNFYLDFWLLVTTFVRSSVLNQLKIEHDAKKTFNDLLNKKIYGLSKAC